MFADKPNRHSCGTHCAAGVQLMLGWRWIVGWLGGHKAEEQLRFRQLEGSRSTSLLQRTV